MKCRWRCIAVAAWLTVSTGAGASTHTIAECFEGADFIANAALARDNGMSRAEFLERMEGDFMVIAAFPRELRWFARDQDDERFLLAAAREVFDVPAVADGHRVRFLAACLDR